MSRINLKLFKEINLMESMIFQGQATIVDLLRQEFEWQVSQKGIEGLVKHYLQYQNKGYVTFVKEFGKGNKAAYAFHFGSIGSDMIIETRYFESSTTGQVKNQLKGGAGVIGNVVGGFFGYGRSFSDEVDLMRKFGQTVTGGGIQPFNEQKHRESELVFRSLLLALESAMNPE